MIRDNMNCARKKLIAVSVAVLVAGVGSAWGLGQMDPLRAGFENPPESSRPRIWWHWMNGNITQEGIKLYLEWMHRVGLAGFQNFDAALCTPQVVEKRLAYMTPAASFGPSRPRCCNTRGSS
jgi:alpha-L-rhamnosidase